MSENDTSWVRGETRGPANAHAPGPPCLEQLEPRLLLSADFGGIESTLGESALSRECAIFIDIDPERADRQNRECQIVTTAERQSHPIVFVDPSIDQSEILFARLSSEPDTR